MRHAYIKTWTVQTKKHFLAQHGENKAHHRPQWPSHSFHHPFPPCVFNVAHFFSPNLPSSIHPPLPHPTNPVIPLILLILCRATTAAGRVLFCVCVCNWQIQTKHLKCFMWGRRGAEGSCSLRNVGSEWPLTCFRDSHMWPRLMANPYSAEEKRSKEKWSVDFYQNFLGMLSNQHMLKKDTACSLDEVKKRKWVRSF